MDKKFALIIFTSVFLLLAALGAQFMTPAIAQPAIINVPKDYPTIQAAINAASPGDIINVSSGTYYEHVAVNKSLSLIGEDRNTTIIDGNRTNTVLTVSADNVKITGFTIRGNYSAWFGIYISSSSNTISGNVFSRNLCDIFLNYSRGNTISGNTVSYGGIYLDNSNDNTISGNELDGSGGLDATGILVAYSSNNTITGNTVSNFGFRGIRLWISSYIKVMYNNLINNEVNLDAPGSGGIIDIRYNYWSDYKGEDVDGDGIGDTLLPHLGEDSYPLITPWSPFRVFNVTLEEEVYQVATFSNSIIASFNFSHLDKQISFNVTGPPGTSGFCNVTIPKTLLRANETHPWQVLLDGNPINYTKAENETHTLLYFTYIHSTHHIQIIPEFPTALILPLLITTALAVAVLRKMTKTAKKPALSRQQ